MAPIAVEAAWPETAGVVARAVAAGIRRIPAGTPLGWAGTVPSTGCDGTAGCHDPAVRGGRVPVRLTVVVREAQVLRGAMPCATGIGAIRVFARPACVPPTVLFHTT